MTLNWGYLAGTLLFMIVLVIAQIMPLVHRRVTNQGSGLRRKNAQITIGGCSQPALGKPYYIGFFIASR